MTRATPVPTAPVTDEADLPAPPAAAAPAPRPAPLRRVAACAALSVVALSGAMLPDVSGARAESAGVSKDWPVAAPASIDSE